MGPLPGVSMWFQGLSTIIIRMETNNDYNNDNTTTTNIINNNENKDDDAYGDNHNHTINNKKGFL